MTQDFVSEELFEPLLLAGMVEDPESFPLYPPFSGVVEGVQVKEGERVRKGQRLLSIVQKPGHDYKAHHIEAPLAGVVHLIALKAGVLVEEKKQLGLIFHPERLEVKVSATINDLSHMTPGQKVWVTLAPQSFYEVKTEGTVGQIDAVADSRSSTFGVQIQIHCDAECEKKARLGTLAKVWIKKNTRNGFKIPIAYLHEHQSKILTLVEGKALWKEVKKGASYGDDAEIVSGLADKTTVVTSFSRKPTDGEILTLATK